MANTRHNILTPTEQCGHQDPEMINDKAIIRMVPTRHDILGSRKDTLPAYSDLTSLKKQYHFRIANSQIQQEANLFQALFPNYSKQYGEHQAQQTDDTNRAMWTSRP
jgi:hypothetical protein